MLRLVGSIDSAKPPGGWRPAAPLPRARTRWSIALLVLLATGCRSDAYREVYTEKMAGQLRVLEDKLYEADYANEVLRQKLERIEREKSASSERRDPGADADDATDETPDVEIEIDREPDGDALDVELEVDDDRDPSASPPLTPAPRRQYPPAQPMPPRAGDLEPEDIDLGEPLPPGRETDEAELPPGQIPTPESARLLAPPVPQSISIHTGLSGRHHHDSDDVEDGLFLVLTINDADGNAIECEEAISVVVLDPDRTGEEARIGRWNFSAKEVMANSRATPVRSVQLPILWQGKQPSGDAVAVFVRVMTETEQPLETDMLLQLKSGEAPRWAPRGLGNRATGAVNPATLF